ncbi:hypothetical protein ASG36_10025 [Geodermatophilus sp. Leaf369]|jgi:signal peptidase|uniref:signal peptidase I n=1 Tax=Geodermatophilus sp. Leaf369 TaxID=1736354 RepID=UPI0007006595|nr:signal peptidase I [Geodermatophilus sp. Leaf369]KQS58408.1 hypothetical protein ASG36_10025 [Geodermatophilus sp. Leaf369]
MTAVLPAPALLPQPVPTSTGLPAGAPLLPRVARAAGRGLADLVVLVAVLAFCFLAAGPHLLGYRTVTMLTASMAPGIEPGDVVVALPIPVAEVEPGMVITYAIPIGDRRVVSHRVVSVDRAVDGTTTIQTQGDANDGLDPWQATLDGDTAWQVRAVVPHLGSAIALLRSPVLTQTLVWVVPAVLVGWALLGIWRPADEEPTDDAAEGDDGERVPA